MSPLESWEFKLTVSINGTSGLVFTDGTTQNTSPFTGGFGFRNRIINGDMQIDQRNAGASGTPTNGAYWVDRWKFELSQASKLGCGQTTTGPNGLNNFLAITSSSAYTVGASEVFRLVQCVEAFNTSDLQWGTASASPVTLSFWVYSSLTGTFGGAVCNSGSTRSYPFSYMVSSANTWTYITITIPGDTSGTWIKGTNGVGLQLRFSLGAGTSSSGASNTWASADYTAPTGSVSVVGTSGASFYITGVQLEKGRTATSFDYRPYGTELALCQRYYEKSYSQSQVPGTIDDVAALWGSVTSDATMLPLSYGYKVTKRASPTVTIYNSATGTVNSFQTGSTNYTVAAAYGSDAVLGRVYSTTSMAINVYSRVCFVASSEL